MHNRAACRKAGAIFQIDNMNGVFHGVMTPQAQSLAAMNNLSGFWWASTCRQVRRVRHLRNIEKFCPDGSGTHKSIVTGVDCSTAAISSARSTIKSAIRCNIFSVGSESDTQSGNAAACVNKAAMSSESLQQQTLSGVDLPANGSRTYRWTDSERVHR